MTSRTCLVIGASGSIGSEIAKTFIEEGYEVWTSSRSAGQVSSRVLQLIGETKFDTAALSFGPAFDAVVWAQGVNQNDSITDVDLEKFEQVMSANTVFVLATLRSLIDSQKLSTGARLCVVSSIWQEVMRTNKLSYSISKAAVGALIKSCAIDLAKFGFLINAVLPGVLETPMTRSVLSDEQLRNVQSATDFNRLVTPAEVAKLVLFLCSLSNTAVTGQSIIADLGFSNVRSI